MAGEAIPLGARLLKVLIDITRLESAGLGPRGALAQLRATFRRLRSAPPGRPGDQSPVPGGPGVVRRPGPPRRCLSPSLRAGNILRADLETKAGLLLVTAGNRITPTLMHRLRNFSALYGIQEPIYIEESDGAGS